MTQCVVDKNAAQMFLGEDHLLADPTFSLEDGAIVHRYDGCETRYGDRVAVLVDEDMLLRYGVPDRVSVIRDLLKSAFVRNGAPGVLSLSLVTIEARDPRAGAALAILNKAIACTLGGHAEQLVAFMQAEPITA